MPACSCICVSLAKKGKSRVDTQKRGMLPVPCTIPLPTKQVHPGPGYPTHGRVEIDDVREFVREHHYNFPPVLFRSVPGRSRVRDERVRCGEASEHAFALSLSSDDLGAHQGIRQDC